MVRKEKDIHYLYKTTCLVTNRYYIGMHSTSNLDDGYMGSGKRLRYSLRKHGVNNHVKEILEFFETRELLIEAEINSITPDMITDTNCMNLKGGGEGGFSSEEHQIKASKGRGAYFVDKYRLDVDFKNKVDVNLNKGRQKLYSLPNRKFDNFKNQTHSEESKEKMSEKAKLRVGKKNSQYGTCWITKDGFNKKIKKEELDSYLNEGWVKGRC